MKKNIPYGRQSISNEDIEAVVDVLRSDFITQGEEIPKFEKSISRYCDADYSLAFNSATSALHVACMSLDISNDDIVWTSPISFVASSNCVLYCGAKIDFVDINISTNNICLSSLEAKLKEAELANALPKAIIPVHLAGLSCDMKKLHELSIKFGFKIIEDASHAIGADYDSSKVGSCKFSDITVFSFHPVKIITSGEGGMLTTNCKKIFKKASKLRSHGISKDPLEFEQKNNNLWYYEQQLLGFNYRMTDFQAALGNSQLKRLDSFIMKRKEICYKYICSLNQQYLDMPSNEDVDKSSNHLFVIKIKQDSDTCSRDQLFKYLHKNHIFPNLHYIPIYRQPFYKKKYNFNRREFPNSENYFKNAISIPVFPSLSSNDQDFIINKINSFFG